MDDNVTAIFPKALIGTSHDLLALISRHSLILKNLIPDEQLQPHNCCFVIMQAMAPIIQLYFGDNPNSKPEDCAEFFHALALHASNQYRSGNFKPMGPHGS